MLFSESGKGYSVTFPVFGSRHPITSMKYDEPIDTKTIRARLRTRQLVFLPNFGLGIKPGDSLLVARVVLCCECSMSRTSYRARVFEIHRCVRCGRPQRIDILAEVEEAAPPSGKCKQDEAASPSVAATHS